MSRKITGAGALLILGISAVIVYKFAAPYLDHKGSSPATPKSQEVSPVKKTRKAIKISIASSNTKEDWLKKATSSFNAGSLKKSSLQVNGNPIHVTIIKETVDGKQKDYRSGTMVKDTLSDKIKPTILSPGSESWVAKFNKEWKSLKGALPVNEEPQIVVRTPIVTAMWRSRAKALGCFPDSGPDCTWEKIRTLAINPKGWEQFGRPEWGNFTFGYGHYGESNSGTLGVLSMCMIGAGKQSNLSMADVEPEAGCGKFIADIEGAKVHSGKSDVWLLEKMISGGQDYLDGVITYESNVIAMNRKYGQRLPEPLVAVYPQDGTVFVGHPFAILDSVPWVTSEEVKAAKIYRDYLLDTTQQENVLALGLRPAEDSIKLSSPIEPGFGANPLAKLIVLEIPDTLVMDRIGEVWQNVKKKAVIVIAFDKSGSMSENGKITAARSGAREFVNLMGQEDTLVWMPFDARVYSGKTHGSKFTVGEDLLEEISAISAGGETALYNAILTALETLKNYQATAGNTMRYGLVVLSDGRDTIKGSSLAKVEAALQPQEGNPSGIQIHTVCIGEDCDEPVLRKVANAAHGRFWRGNTEQEMIKIYRNIATHY